MKPCFLSIIIPIYNGERYLKETIKSILQQPCKDFELILLDDGSTDHSLAICQEFENEKQLRIYSHPNMGVSRTRNKGISLAKGELMIFLDQDDAMRSDFYTDKIHNNLKSMLEQGVDLFVCGAWNGDAELQKGTFMSIEHLKQGLYEGHSDELSWGNMYTFNMNIFSKTLFFDEADNPTPIRFFDLPLDVETIFRHVTLYAAKKIYFSDAFSFCVRRNNEYSVSSNWDWFKVYKVKIKAYYDLIAWHKKYFGSDVQAIEGAEKALLRVVDEAINLVNDVSSLYRLQKSIREQSFFNELLELESKYLGYSTLFKKFMDSSPDIYVKKVSLFRKIIRLRWNLCRMFQKKIKLRKEILSIKI